MNQAAGESPQQRPFPPLRNLANKAYALIPRRGDFVSRLEQQEATITYLLVWLGNGQPVSIYAPPSACCPRGLQLNSTIGKCTGLPWNVDHFYTRELDRGYHANWDICRTLDNINAWARYLDEHPELDDHPNDARAPPLILGPSP